MSKPIPEEINGTPVEQLGDPLSFQGEEWVTLVPSGDDEHIWEFSLTTGRLLLTHTGEE